VENSNQLFQINNDIRTIGQQLTVQLIAWRNTIIENIPSIIIALIVLALAFTLNDRAQRAVERLVGRDEDRRELARLLGRVARFGVLFAAVVIILAIFNQTAIVASFVASLGIAGLVIAFALQDITKNFAAGVLLLILRPFRLNDRIKVRDFEGRVLDISLRATTLRTSDGIEVLVPNADVYTSPIINLTRYDERRYHVTLSVPSTTPLPSVKQRIQTTLQSLPSLGEGPPPEVVATGVEDDTVALDVRFWLPSDIPNADTHVSTVIEQLRAVVTQIKAETEQAAAASDGAKAGSTSPSP
jgi:small conductance mechanosensitive channel